MIGMSFSMLVASINGKDADECADGTGGDERQAGRDRPLHSIASDDPANAETSNNAKCNNNHPEE